MADKKISQLNAAATIYDADDFAVVQDGETKQANASVVKTYVKAGFTKADAGLGNVDNTSDATKNSATATLTNKTISGSSNTLSNIGNSSLTNSAITFGATSQALGSTVSALNAVSIGGTTPAAGNFTTLGATGNVTLGDGTGDTLTINGTAVSAPNGLNVNSNQLVLSSGNVTLGAGSLTLGNGGASTASTLTINGGNTGPYGPAIFGQAASSNEWLICSLRGVAGAGAGLGGLVDYVYGAYPRVFYTNGAERLRIDSSGSVGIGTSSLSAKLHVNGGSMWVINSAADPRILVGEGSGANEYGYLLWDRTANTLNLRTNANPIAFGSDTADWMRIDSSGNVGIGTGSPGYKLDVAGTIRSNVSANTYAFLIDNGTYSGGLVPSSATGGLILYNAVAQPLGFWTNNTERMRITAAGNLLVGDTTNWGGKLAVTNTPTSQWGIDQSGSQLTIANGANAVLAAGSGLIVLNSRTSGGAGAYLVCGSSVVLLGGTTGYVVGTTPAAGQTSIGWDGSNYRIYNNVGFSQTFGIAMIRSRDAN